MSRRCSKIYRHCHGHLLYLALRHQCTKAVVRPVCDHEINAGNCLGDRWYCDFVSPRPGAYSVLIQDLLRSVDGCSTDCPLPSPIQTQQTHSTVREPHLFAVRDLVPGVERGWCQHVDHGPYAWLVTHSQLLILKRRGPQRRCRYHARHIATTQLPSAVHLSE